jgi:hypothetical protein
MQHGDGYHEEAHEQGQKFYLHSFLLPNILLSPLAIQLHGPVYAERLKQIMYSVTMG